MYSYSIAVISPETPKALVAPRIVAWSGCPVAPQRQKLPSKLQRQWRRKRS